ncbi:MAG TPA: SGNH/GDSL hydrolase family protein [Tepidisphaeraceae bacterium]|nr:SGNH/GDSL hydrolase family protein [Tepidisphaeraceae bacterium]
MFTSDSFTDTAGTLLETHTGETGAAWTRNPAFSSGSAAITAAGRLRGNSSGFALYYSSGVPASADYDVEADLFIASASDTTGLLGRQSTSAATYYLFDYEFATGQWRLYTVVNGATLNTAVFAQTLIVGQTYHVRLSMRGSAIACFVNGTQIISLADSNITAAGRAGVLFGNLDTDSTGTQIDNFTAAVPSSIAVTDSNLFFSPYNWQSDGAGALQANNVNASSTFAQSNTPGAYCKFTVNAAASGYVSLLLDTSPLSGISAGNCPQIACSVDGQALFVQLLAFATGVTRLVLSGSLSSGNHTFLVHFRSVTLNSSSAMGDRWNTPASVVKITGIELDGKGSATASQTLHGKNLLVYGDSITEGADAVGASNNNADQDSTQTYAQLLASALDAEVGIVGFSGQGWTVSGYGNVPKFYDTTTPANSTFDKYSSGFSRLRSGLLSPAPDYILVLHGTNDANQGATDAAVTSTVSAWLSAVRADAASGQIFVTIPFGGGKRSAITGGFNAVSDSNAHLVDLGTTIEPTLSAGGINTNDGMHPNVRGHATFAALLANQLRQLIAPPASASNFTASSGDFAGGSIQLSTGAFAA